MPAAAEPVVVDADASVAPRRGRRKLIALGAAVLLAGAGGAVAWTVKQRRDAEPEAEGAEASAEEEPAEAAHAPEPRTGPPVFLPLESFVVNLADRGSDRYAQVGITLELEDGKYTDQLRAYMPAIRNGILMVLAHKTSQELLTREGKERLAAEIMREAVRPLGIALPEPGNAPGDDGAAPAPGRVPLPEVPVRHVHFSSFIIQ